MLVDDDLSVRRLLAEALRLEGFDVEVGSDVDEGWEAIERAQPQLVVLDVMMPGADGLTLLRRVRESSSHRDLPVILLSARTQPDDLRSGDRAGADMYITKPFSIEHLVWSIDEAIRGRPRSRVTSLPEPLERLRRNGPIPLEELVVAQRASQHDPAAKRPH